MSKGRPANLEDKDLVTVQGAIERAEELLGIKPWVPRTLRNKICKGELTRYGTYRYPMVDWDEVKRLLNWRRKAG